jgi:hypothetical protein
MSDEAFLTADHWRRTWLVLLLDGAAKAGLTPVDQTIMHQAAYLANALAPIYDLPVEHGLVTRWKRGPFFAEVQWDLDRLAVMGLATLHSVATGEDNDGWWFRVQYTTGPRTHDFLREVQHLEQVRRWSRFHRELMASLASLPDADLRWATIADANYANTVDGDLEASEVVIDFDELRKRNFTTRTVRRIDRQLPKQIALADRDRIHLYLAYLARRSRSERP